MTKVWFDRLKGGSRAAKCRHGRSWVLDRGAQTTLLWRHGRWLSGPCAMDVQGGSPVCEQVELDPVSSGSEVIQRWGFGRLVGCEQLAGSVPAWVKGEARCWQWAF